MRSLGARCCAAGSLAAITMSCVTMAVPSPLATLGGSRVAEIGHSEAGIGLGTGMSLFPDAHAGGSGWLGRWRQGLGDGFDLGIDVMGVQHSDKGTIDLGVGARYQLSDHLRLEAVVGGADDSSGQSLNAQVGLTLGTNRPEWAWNYYGSFRFAGTQGLPGNIIGGGPDNGTPPDDLLVVAAVGASSAIGEGGRFVGEFGAGPAFVQGQSDVGVVFYFGAALLFDIGRINKPE